MIDPMMNLIILFINDKALRYGSEAGRGREQGLRVERKKEGDDAENYTNIRCSSVV